ncbi:MAG: hypothetical protein K2V38_17080, partial [Gemmataceae bacterium]|nr:hypothetical protein [Gemmataceae bacterium]
EVIPLLLDAVLNPAPYPRGACYEVALRALARPDFIDKLGPHTDTIVPKLVEHLDSQDEAVGEGFASLGRRAAAAVPDLVAMLDTDNPYLMEMVVSYLAGIATPEAVRAVVGAATGRKKVNRAARERLTEWAKDGAFMDALQALTVDPETDPKTRKNAVALLESLMAK